MDEFRNVWQKQEVEEMKISVDELRAKAAKFHSRIRWRNLREQAACLVVVVSFGAMGLKSSQTIPRISFALIVAGAIYIAWHMQRRGAPKSLPADMGRANCVGFYRRELERQRDLLSSVWKWYLGPLIPGMALLIIYGLVIVAPGRRWFAIVYAVFAAVAFWVVGWMNQRAAQRLNSQIAELDRELGDL